MQKKQNPRNPKYFSFTVSRDSFVDLGKLNTIDTSALVATSRHQRITDFYSPISPIERKSRLEKPLNRFSKRIIDIFLSTLVILLILSWLIPILAILIKLNSKGPTFIRQKRKKRDGQLFSCISFCTRPDAGRKTIRRIGQRLNSITPIGRFLQNTGLDSIPQFLNVLLGDMSIIGPKAYNEFDSLKYEKLLSGYSRRYAVKPGITSLNQVSRHSGSDGNIRKMKARTRLDQYYVNHWSAALDCKILYQSLRKMAGLGLNYSQNFSRESS